MWRHLATFKAACDETHEISRSEFINIRGARTHVRHWAV